MPRLLRLRTSRLSRIFGIGPVGLFVVLALGGAAVAQTAPSQKPAPHTAPAKHADVSAVTASASSALDRGTSYAETQAAIATLGDAGEESASPALARYAVHRDPRIRRAVVKALARTRGPAAAVALRHALTDPDPAVRATAASGLGALKTNEAVPDLFLALDHRIHEAAASIGQLCDPAQCAALADRLGKVPFEVATGGLDAILFRPASEVPDDTKIAILTRIRELKTAEANKFLQDVLKRWPAGWSPKVKASIAQSVELTMGGSQ